MAKKSLKSRTLILILTAILLLAGKPLSAEIALPSLEVRPNYTGIIFEHASADLWQYLRAGLNYLESPSPLQPPETVPPTYIHPDSKGFGAYGFSPGAYEDVQRIYPFFQQYSWQDIINSSKLYDLANQAFADRLLKNLKDYIPVNASKEEIFDVIHQAWNLGLTGFKNGRSVVASRTKRAGEFKSRAF